MESARQTSNHAQADMIEAARQQRAEAIRSLLTQFVRRQPHRSVLPGASASPPTQFALLAAVGVLGLMTYALLVPRIGVAGFSPSVLTAVTVASMISSIAGFAFSAICGALLLHLMNGPVHIVELMVVCSIAIQSLSVWSLRRSLDWRALPPFLIGGIISLPFGVYLLLHTQQKVFATLMGGFLIAYGVFMLLRRPMRLRHNLGRTGHGIAGLLGGITGGLAGFPGALVTIWCGLQGWDKKQQRSIYQPFILIMQVLTLLVIHVMRGATADAGSWLAWGYVPGALLGTWCGLRLFECLSDRQFGVAVNLLLVMSGAGLFVA